MWLALSWMLREECNEAEDMVEGILPEQDLLSAWIGESRYS